MLIEQTINKMNQIKLFQMSEKLQQMDASGTLNDLSNQEFISYLVDCEYVDRENRKRTRLLRQAGLKYQAHIEELDYRLQRNLDKSYILELTRHRWIKNKQNILISGPTGIGKSFLACALGYHCCDYGIKTLYLRMNRYLEEVNKHKGLGEIIEYYQKLSKFTVLIIDDFGLSTLKKVESLNFLDLIEDRYLNVSTIITSQIPLDKWYEVFTDGTVADAICDRIFHNAHKIELHGDSMRKTENKTKKT